MKRYLFSLLAVVFSTLGMQAMSYEEAREQAYYLTDKMAYELNLNDEQYNDAYEINLDYLLNLRTEADINGPYWEYRNTDLRYILYDWQWSVYAAADYFYRPVWWYNGGWLFPIYNRYVRGYFWFDRPHCFWDYTGAHWHHHHLHASYYVNRRHAWNGGLRGRENTLVGHPYGNRSGRYGAQEGGRGNGLQSGRGNGLQGGRGNAQQGSRSGRYGTQGGSRGYGQSERGNSLQSGRGTSRGSYDGPNRRTTERGTFDASKSRGSYQQSTPSTSGRSSSRGSFSGSSTRGSYQQSTPSHSSGSNFGGGSRGGSSFSGSSRGGSSMGGSSRGGRR